MLIEWIHHKVLTLQITRSPIKTYYLKQLLLQTEADIEDLGYDMDDY
jgi:hypothetical protein